MQYGPKLNSTKYGNILHHCRKFCANKEPDMNKNADDIKDIGASTIMLNCFVWKYML